MNSPLMINKNCPICDTNKYSKIVYQANLENRFNHIDGSIQPPNNQRSFPVYLSKDQNLKDYICNILKYHDINNISKNEYKKLIWDENKNNLDELL